MREAVKTLAAKGMVETRTRAGTIVQPSTHWSMLDPDMLRWFLETRSDPAFARGLIEARELVEPFAAKLAAERFDPAHLATIEAACGMMARNIESEEQFLEADLAFHVAVLEASANSVLEHFGHAVRAALLLSFERSLEQEGAMQRALPLHEAVLAAIRRRDPVEASNAMMLCVRADGERD